MAALVGSPSVPLSKAPSDSIDIPASPSGEIVEMETFQQILDLDEDDTYDFSKGMVWDYFDQAQTTFLDMEHALAHKDLAKLSALGHFLKGSSAALGLTKVQASCELIQHYGQLRDEDANVDLTVNAALKKIGLLLHRVKEEYADAEVWLKKFFEPSA